MLVTFQEQRGTRYSPLSLDILVCLKKSKKIGHIRQFRYFFIDCYLFIYLFEKVSIFCFELRYFGPLEKNLKRLAMLVLALL